MNTIDLFFKWRKKLHPLPQASVDILTPAIILITGGWLIGFIFPAAAFGALLLGGLLLSLGSFVLSLTIAWFIYKKLKP